MAIAKSPQPEGERSLAGEYLECSLQAIRNACSSDTLYRPMEAGKQKDEKPKKYAGVVDWLLKGDAAAQRTNYSRTSMLYSAFAAEAFINEFIDAHFTGEDFRSLDKLSTVDKFVIAPQLILGERIFDRGKTPLNDIAQLFKYRDGWVHPKPGAVIKRNRGDSAPDEIANPKVAAKHLVSVAKAALAIRIEWHGVEHASKHLDMWSVAIDGASGYIKEFARKATVSLPTREEKPAPANFMFHLVDRSVKQFIADQENG